MHQTPIIALCGFLGSGKTTLMRRWRREPSVHNATIVHDFSDLGLDAELLAPEHITPIAGRLVGRLAALHGSHTREHLKTSVGRALDDIAALNPPAPLVLCESTGAARPWPFIAAITQNPRFFLRHFIVTVDALNLHRDFSDGLALVGQTPLQDPSLKRAAEVLAEQLLFASVIILTKVDTVDDEIVSAQVRLLRQLQPKATIALSAYAGLLLDKLDAALPPQPGEMAAWAERFGMTDRAPTPDDLVSLVLNDPRPFHPQRLYDACQRQLATGVYRTKGFVWLASRDDQVLLWQQSGSQVGFEAHAFLQAEAAYNDPGDLPQDEVDALKAKLASAHPVFADRRNELTVIGEKVPCISFHRALQRALCTPKEVAAWQRGEPFDDPWPTSVRHVNL